MTMMPVGFSSRLTRLRHVVALAYYPLWQLCLAAIKVETRRVLYFILATENATIIWQTGHSPTP